MKYHHVNPVLYSADVLKSLRYYTEILGFENSWNWGKPPTFGGVSKNGVEIFFCEKGQGNPGTWLSVFVDNVDELYESFKTRGAKIVSAPETMPWGVREMLVEDPDEHKIRFGSGVNSSSNKKLSKLPSTIKIVHRAPTAKEHLGLITAVGWSSSMTTAMEEKALSAPVFSVVAEDTISGETIGCALLLGDDVSFYYVKDVMVHPAWQLKRIGTALMKEITTWLDANGAPHALVGLYTGNTLSAFYEKFGFTPAFGMNRKINSHKENSE